jgi:hypothetical protein
MSNRIDLVRELIERGFSPVVPEDKREHIKIKCTQCAPMLINEFASHELGCPNERTLSFREEEEGRDS